MVLDQGKLRGANRRFEAEAISLGNEPPLSVDGGTGGLVDRRRLSLQWFAGTILTGLCGAALMGGAVFASLDGRTDFATAPERVEIALRGAIAGIGGRLSGIHKTDRLAAISEPSVARQILRVPISTKVRDREIDSYTLFRPCRRHSLTHRFRTLRQHSSFQPAKTFDRQRRQHRRRAAGGGTGRRSVVRHLRFAVRRQRQSVAGGLRSQLAVAEVKPATRLSLDEVVARVRDVASKLPTSSPSLPAQPPARRPVSSSVMRRKAIPTLMSGSRRASYRKTSRFAPRPTPATTGANISSR